MGNCALFRPPVFKGEHNGRFPPSSRRFRGAQYAPPPHPAFGVEWHDSWRPNKENNRYISHKFSLGWGAKYPRGPRRVGVKIFFDWSMYCVVYELWVDMKCMNQTFQQELRAYNLYMMYIICIDNLQIIYTYVKHRFLELLIYRLNIDF